ncbi:uncharacterized protein LOC132041976 [Lycium ferocissimum]|uniref:uncharacterized protein LOC132041976 n=1 Tax=Lycium ferocissimum TaxID=112874 RepID=UPI002815E9E5|nr:uncharacterized protein LOC132041976 [Lycium ferocissimum]
MIRTTVLQVNFNCVLCKKFVLQAISRREGIDSATIKTDQRKLIVVGTVRPEFLVKEIRKIPKEVEIIEVTEHRENSDRQAAAAAPSNDENGGEQDNGNINNVRQLPRMCRECQTRVGVEIGCRSYR